MAIKGFEGAEAAEGAEGAVLTVCGVGLNGLSFGIVGGFGAAKLGGFGGEGLAGCAAWTSLALASAPILTPAPVFLSFGMPTPAKMPPS